MTGLIIWTILTRAIFRAQLCERDGGIDADTRTLDLGLKSATCVYEGLFMVILCHDFVAFVCLYVHML